MGTESNGPSESVSVWRDLASLLLFLNGLLAAAGTFVDQLQPALPGFVKAVPRPMLLFVALALLGLVVMLQRHRLARFSELKRPEAFHLRPEEHLVGREQDVARLLELLSDERLVFLVGESGVGKTALLRAGLVPRLRQDAAKLPIYVGNWGSDWIEGPRGELVDAVYRALGVAGKGGQEGRITGESVFSYLRELQEKTGRRPVLLFDQFDDYQARHRAKFLSPRGDWISPRTLLRKNPFFLEIGRLLDEQRVQCLFAAREDSFDALDSVRISEPATYRVYRLGKGQVLPLLENVSGGDVVARAQNGWESLKRRLAHDLEKDGSVLPIQMKVALHGLASLEFLTPSHYRRKGGLAGLEAEQIAHAARGVAQAARVNEACVRSVLLAMVDAEARKTLVIPEAALLGLLPEDQRREQVVRTVLGVLETAEIVRVRSDPDSGARAWQLDHDYLCQGVLELHRRAQFWPLLLREAHQAFESAPGLIPRWRRLLDPWTQLQLLFQRLRGRLRYGEASRYAALSGLRLMVSLPVLALLPVWLLWHDITTERQGARLFSEMQPTNIMLNDLTAREAEVLWQLAVSDYRLRRTFLQQALTSNGAAMRFLNRFDRILHAVVGYDVPTRERLARDVLPECYNRRGERWDATLEACVVLVMRLEAKPPLRIPFFLRAMRLALDTGWVNILGTTLAADSEKLSQEQIRQAGSLLLAAIRKGEGTAVAKAIVALTGKLPADLPATAVSSLLGSATGRVQASDAANIASALASLRSALTPGQRVAAVSFILRSLKQRDLLVTDLLARALCELGEAAEIRQGASLLLEAMQRSSNANQMEQPATALASLAGKLPTGVAEKAGAMILKRMKPPEGAVTSLDLGSALAALGSQEQVASAAAILVQQIRSGRPDDEGRSLVVRCLANLGRGVSKPDAAWLASQLLGELDSRASMNELRRFGRAISGLAPELPTPEAKRILKQVIEVFHTHPAPPCEVFEGFVRAETVPELLEVLKWPTCEASTIGLIIDRIGEVGHVSFRSKPVESSTVDIWGFAAWADRNYSGALSRPVRPPAKVQVVEGTGLW